MLKKILLWALGVVAVLAIVIAVTMGPTLRDFMTIEYIEEDGIAYIMDYGGNSGLIIGKDKAILIDTKMAKGAKKLKKYVEDKIGDKELIVINTHFHPDHVLGNEFFNGNKIYAGDYGKEFWLEDNKENTLPTDWISTDIDFDLGDGETVKVFMVGQNHTLKDLFIYSPKHEVLFAGDIYTHESHPVMKEGSKPDIEKWEATLRSYAGSDLPIKTVVPGHGDLAKKEDLTEMADYFRDIKTMPKKELKQKYKKWESLPFLAGLNKSLKYLEGHRS